MVQTPHYGASLSPHFGGFSSQVPLGGDPKGRLSTGCNFSGLGTPWDFPELAGVCCWGEWCLGLLPIVYVLIIFSKV